MQKANTHIYSDPTGTIRDLRITFNYTKEENGTGIEITSAEYDHGTKGYVELDEDILTQQKWIDIEEDIILNL